MLVPSLALLGPIGTPEMIVIGIVGLLIFGRRLPEVGKSLGKGIVEFKKGLAGIEDDLSTDQKAVSTGQKSITIDNQNVAAAAAGGARPAALCDSAARRSAGTGPADPPGLTPVALGTLRLLSPARPGIRSTGAISSVG